MWEDNVIDGGEDTEYGFQGIEEGFNGGGVFSAYG